MTIEDFSNRTRDSFLSDFKVFSSEEKMYTFLSSYLTEHLIENKDSYLETRWDIDDNRYYDTIRIDEVLTKLKNNSSKDIFEECLKACCENETGFVEIIEKDLDDMKYPLFE